MKEKSKIIIVVTIIALLFLYACSTRKNTTTSRMYHNITLRYNIYFNGNEAYKRGLNRIYNQNTDNYNEILPVFVDSKEDLASSASGEMDKGIQKASKGIKYHSITVKPEIKKGKAMSKSEQEYYNQNEFNKWVDDSYLLMGKSYFIKRDYLQARYNFEYITRQFPKEESRHMANLYLARTFAEQRNFRSAKETLDYIEGQKDLPKKYEGYFNAIYADYFIKQKQYEDAIPKLAKAIELTKKKKDRLRYSFIIAQIYEKLGNLDKAVEIYETVTKRNKSYEMEFNAKINLAKCYAKLGIDTKDIRKKLRKMLKDDKNIEYRDQIYYAIAELDLNADNIPDAIYNFKQASETSVANDYQKAMACLRLGEIYFSELDYKNAQIYYDTCIMFLPPTYEDYSKIRMHSLNLNELIKYVEVVEFEDSVQKLAKMSDKDRNKIIDKIIADLIEQERLEREMEREMAVNSMLFDERRGISSSGSMTSSDGKWYFYNPSQLSYGKNEFTKKWGNRKNEDNWRRKNKAQLTLFDESEEMASDSSSSESQRLTNTKSREYYLQDIPLTDSAMTASNNKIINALFNMGRIYKEKFTDYPKSISSYESLNSRYPDNEYIILTYYNLYLLNKLLNNSEGMMKYQNLLTSKFPDSNYAKLLQNPNYIQELEEKRIQNEQLYIETYDSYMDGRCDEVIANANKFLNEDESSELVPKFEFLRTMCIGKTSDTTEFKTSLINFMQKYSNDELSTVAQYILQYFGTTDIQALIAELKARPTVEKPAKQEIIEKKPDEEINADKEQYVYDPTAEHYYAIYVKSEDVDMKRLSFEVRNFNIFNFSMRTFNVVNTQFNTSYELITVRTFKNQRQSSNYSKMIANSEDVFDKLKDAEYKTFVISVDNLSKLQNNKSINGYLKFFNENYPK